MPGVRSSSLSNDQITAMAWDQYAAQALAAMISRSNRSNMDISSESGRAVIAKNAAAMADARLMERIARKDLLSPPKR